jgi:hypothetical protein
MAETVQQYIARITGLTGEADPRSIMRATPARLRELIEHCGPRALTWTPSPQRWSIVQIAAHLADSEIVGAWRFRSVLASDGIALQAFDQDAWASAFRYDTIDAAHSVALFEALRRSTLHALDVVDPARLEHAGMHQERGRESIAQLLRMYAGHDLNHLGQIERLIADARASGST